MLFSIAMTFSRFVGDGIVARFGNRFVLTLGGVIALLGLCGLLLAPVAWIGLVSFVFVALEPQTSCLSCSDSRVRNTKCQRDWPLPPSPRRVTPAC
jgi:hypothetical protein